MGALVPTLTSNIDSTGEANASSKYSSSHDAYKAFNGDLSDYGWMAANGSSTNQWLQYKFSRKVVVRSFKVTNHTETTKCAKNITLQGSNDGSQFKDLGSFTNSNTSNGTTYYNVDNSTAYTHYRLFIHNGHSNETVRIAELQFYAEPEGASAGGVDIKDTLILEGICLPVSIQGSSYTTVSEVLYNVQGYNKLSTKSISNNCSGKISVSGAKARTDGSYNYRDLDDMVTLATSGTDLVLTDVDISDYDVVYIRNHGGAGVNLAAVVFSMTLSK